MGLIDFVKSAGAKVKGIFDKDDDTPEVAAPTGPTPEMIARHQTMMVKKLTEGVNRLPGIEIRDLSIRFDQKAGRATVSGITNTQADAEKIVLAVGNVRGVGQVDNQITVENPEPPAIYHTVVAGDTLSKISLATYGVIHLYDDIFAANQPLLNDPSEIYPGQVLRIPPVTAPVHTVAAGETLGKIAKHWYGDAKAYTRIFDANRSVLSDPNTVSAGQKLTIPLGASAPALV